MYYLIINGPNLNLLGRREPEIYGYETFEETLNNLRKSFRDDDIRYYQSNHEGDLIDKIQSAGFDSECLGIIMNPGAYAHYSYALADAIRSIPVSVIEVHISDISSREEFRRNSITAASCTDMISGCGREGYKLALEKLKKHSL